MAPEESGIKSAVSVSVMPCPSAAEGSGRRIIIGERANAGHAVANPGSDGIGPLLILLRSDREGHLLAAPAHLQVRGLLARPAAAGIETALWIGRPYRRI